MALAQRRRRVSFYPNPSEEDILRDIVSGVVLIAIGLIFGGSIFLGEFSLFSVFFDGLGIFLIVRGAMRMYRARQEAKPPA